MKTRFKKYLLLVLLLCSIIASAKQGEKKISLPEVNIERADFLAVMDSIIDFEKNCDYYTDSLFFSIWFLVNPEDTSMYQINIYPDNRKELVFGLTELVPRAFFQHRGHICVINNFYDEVPEQIFSFTKKKREFRYVDHYQLYLEGKGPLILMPEDGPFSTWIYYFYDDIFHFQVCSNRFMQK